MTVLNNPQVERGEEKEEEREMRGVDDPPQRYSPSAFSLSFSSFSTFPATVQAFQPEPVHRLS